MFTPEYGFLIGYLAKIFKIKEPNSETSLRQKNLKSVGVTLKSSGVIHFERPDYFEWQVQNPRNFSFIFKDNNISILEDGKVVKKC